MKILKSLICLLVLKFSLAGAEQKVINFGTTNDYPPFEFIGPDGTLQGFDIDVAKSLCAKMQAECKFNVLSFDSLIPSLKLGKIDAVIASLSYSQNRAKEVDFTSSYYQNEIGLVALKSDYVLALNKVSGKIIGIQTGTVYGDYLKKHYGDTVAIKYYENTGEMFMDLVNGRIDVVMGDLPVIIKQFKNKPQAISYQTVVVKDIDEDLEKIGNFIIVRKDNAEMLAKLNKGITEIHKDGTIKKLAQQYFGD